jgi:hypothetical protein
MQLHFPAAVLSLLATVGVVAEPSVITPNAGQVSFFEHNIRPILVSKCYDCHSAQAKKIKGGLLLDTRDGIRKGGDSGPAVVPGNPRKSLLMHVIEYKDKDKQMPPKEALSASVVADFERWITMGAPDPRDRAGTAKPVVLGDPRKFWSFQQVKHVVAPLVKDTTWPRGDIDRFVQAGLESKELKAAPDASKPVLLRRVYFDLIGLPPTPAELQTFVNDTDPKAFEKVVDKLLASPGFGERWGRHWLDVARYAESTGKERNFPFPDAWRYRDYVIASFNADKPYDQFIREQIAGDLLPAKNAAERNEHLIATGFLAIGPKGLNEKNREQFRMDEIDEQIDTSTRAVLALTVACARCHDHKFDPISQKDYYGIAGIFRSSETYFGVNGADGMKNRQPSPPLDLVAVDWRPSTSSGVAPVIPEADRGNRKKGKNKKNQAMQTAAVTSNASAEHAMGMLDGRPGDCPLYVRGEVENQGPTVPRALPAILNGPWVPKINPVHSGRLELAIFMTREENPLTARVMANRIWQQLFGRGLVSTSDNFGATGELPTHPELLDHLAGQFVSCRWSVKKMVRSIVLSHVYQLSSELDKSNYAVDPDNRMLWRASPRRLDAESIRDSMLAVSGELELAPPTPSESAQAVKVGKGKAGKKFPVATAESASARRSLYLPIIRDKLPDVLELFDFAEPSLVVTSRDVTTVPSQALFMMNSAFVQSQSTAMAKRLLEHVNQSDAIRIRSAYLTAFLRAPTSAEEARAEAYLARCANEYKLPTEKAWATFCQALFGSSEFRYLN